MPHAVNGLLVGTLGQHNADRVAGCDIEHDKGNQADAEQHDKRLQKALDGVFNQTITPLHRMPCRSAAHQRSRWAPPLRVQTGQGTGQPPAPAITAGVQLQRASQDFVT